MKIDVVLPYFSETLSQGAYVHFRQLALALADRGHDVVVRAGNRATLKEEAGGVRWLDPAPTGPCRVGGLDTVYYAHLPRLHPRNLGPWFAARWTVLVHAWELHDNPRPIDLWRIQQLNPDQTRDLTRSLRKKAAAAGPSDAHYSTYALGPNLPMGRMIADAKKRGAVVIAGYFPFRTCPDAVRAGREAGVPVWIIPLFHAQDVPHQNEALLQAARDAAGVLPLSPFNTAFFTEAVGCRRVVCMGSAPPSLDAMPPAAEKPGHPYCVVFGRFHAGKNVGEAVRIVDAARRRGIPDLELKVIATDSKHLRRSLPPYASVLSDISTEEAARTLAGARALLFPSLHESFGIVCFEALRCGTPALIRRANHATASLFDELNLSDFAYAEEKQAVDLLGRICGDDLVLPEDLSLNRFTWPAIAETVEQAIGHHDI